ncbi:YceI family protein [Hyphomicrobium sp. 99]|uniref:YceI family protein n=1 Tax=Hyphomicrobium sp. 99 TaxID=1163419 RepID=UPI0009E3CC52|nr:YceI family protein [Hyphomicrobium sp. 99]
MRKSLSKGCAYCVAFIVLAGFASSAAHAEIYIFDARRTEVRFTYVMGISKQQGHFNQVQGTLQFDEKAPEKSQVSATIATASLGTGEPIVDDELKGSDFFNVAADPVMTFKSRAVRSTGADTAEMTGDITVNGITMPVTFAISLHPHTDPALKHSNGAREFVATGRIQRSAFRMTAYQSMVGDDIDIEIDAIVRKKT